MNNKPQDAFILVGGLGTRLKKVISSVPKPMAPINGVPFLDILIKYWRNKGIKNFYLLTGYKSDVIKDYFGNHYYECNIFYSNEKEPLDTGGAFLKGLKFFEKNIKNKYAILLNGDTWFDFNFENLVNDHIKSGKLLTIAIKEITNNNRYGNIILSDKGEVITIKKPEKELAFSRINVGCYIFESSTLLNHLEHFSNKFSLEDDLLPFLMKKRKIGSSLNEGSFIDIGIPSDFRKASQILT